MTRLGEKPVSVVPGACGIVLASALALQCALRWDFKRVDSLPAALPSPPAALMARAAAFGDPIPVAKLLMLHLQSFDYAAGNQTPYQALDYSILERWLDLILMLDPHGQYPLMSASRVYAEVPQELKRRQMLDFVYRRFLEDPRRRWPWLAHAAAIAKHRLHDLPLARSYAAAIQRFADGPEVPTWARQMEAFILEDMNELETARIMIGGFLEKGMVKDAGEARFLEQRLKEIQRRLESSK
jgi:hypothetical protein